MTLKNWLENSWLVSHTPTAEEISNLLAISDRDLTACRLQQLPADWRFTIAHNAALHFFERKPLLKQVLAYCRRLFRVVSIEYFSQGKSELARPKYHLLLKDTLHLMHSRSIVDRDQRKKRIKHPDGLAAGIDVLMHFEKHVLR